MDALKRNKGPGSRGVEWGTCMAFSCGNDYAWTTEDKTTRNVGEENMCLFSVRTSCDTYTTRACSSLETALRELARSDNAWSYERASNGGGQNGIALSYSIERFKALNSYENEIYYLFTNKSVQEANRANPSRGDERWM